MHGQMEPVTSNPYHLKPVLRHHAYPATAWERMLDKDVMRTFIMPPYINDKVTSLSKLTCQHHDQLVNFAGSSAAYSSCCLSDNLVAS